MSITLRSGFEFSYDNLCGKERVTKEEITELLPRIKQSAEAINIMRKDGVIKGHLSKDNTPELVLFSQLPYVKEGNLNSEKSISRLKAFGEKVKDRVDVLISLGIGGSYLGNKVLFDATCGDFWNLNPAKRAGYPEIYFSGNNIDAQRTNDLIEYLKQKAQEKPLTVMLMVISKSGGTVDTMSCFLVLKEELEKIAGITLEIVAVTDPNEEKPTLLKKLAIQNGWETFAVPDGVGGRFSVFSEVALAFSATFGFDIDNFLAGARAMDEECKSENIEENPALMNAVLKYLAAKNHGRTIEVMMPYGDYLKSLSEWYIQLLAESLGKEIDREGKRVYAGRTPLVAVGTTDMHAQTQQHQEGALDKIVQFVRVANWKKDYKIPLLFEEEGLIKLSGIKMSEALEVARASNEEALKNNGRYTACFILPEYNAYHLGELMYLLALSVAYEGELLNIDAFNQPGVEAYKKIMGPSLAALKKK